MSSQKFGVTMIFYIFLLLAITNSKGNPVTNEENDDIKKSFAQFDKDGDGAISIKELGDVMMAMGESHTEQELLDKIAEIDTDGNKIINLSEYMKLMTMKINDEDTEEEIHLAFPVFDQDGNGLISAQELGHTMMNLGEKLTNEDIAEMIKPSDADGDGSINKEEFVKFMKEP